MVDLLPSDEQNAIQQELVNFLSLEMPVDRLHQGDVTDGIDALIELGWLGLALPEQAGGAGAGLADEAQAFRAFGEALVSPAAFATVLAAHLSVGLGDEGRARAILEGGARVGLAVPAAKAGECYLIAAQQADLLLMVDKGCLALIPAPDVVDRVACDPLDGTVDLQRAVLGSGGPVGEGLAEAEYDRFLVLLAAYQLGVAEAALRTAVEYSKLREQFGRPIGAFQSIKHLCADARMRTEAAQFQTIYAGLASQDGHEDARAQALSALIVAEEAAILNAEAAIQIHGGMGFTDECTAHLFLKRARLMSRLGGGRACLLDKLAALS